MSDGQDLRETSPRHLDEGRAHEPSTRRAAVNDDVVGSIDCELPATVCGGRPAGGPLDRGPTGIDRKPLHYKVICISMYTEDLTRLDRMVEALKSRGLTRANRSALIRHALSAVDLERVPKGL